MSKRDAGVTWITGTNRLPGAEAGRAAFEQFYFAPMMNEGTRAYVANADTTVHFADLGGTLIPVTINDAQYDNTYVCSPYSAYASYAREELYVLRNPLLEKALAGLLAVIAPLLRLTEFNRVAHVNNWLLSTNIHGPLAPAELERVTTAALAAYPQHAIVIRSLNERLNGAMMRDLAKLGYHFAPSRQVYLFDGAHPGYMDKTNTVRDQKLLDESPYMRVAHNEFSEQDYGRVKELYDLLYIRKYSAINPQFTEAYIRLCHERGLLTLHGLRDSGGALQGVIGCFERHGVVTAPLVGYNTALPREHGLYRMLMAIVLRSTAERGLMLNLSSGAASFKRLRGGEAEIEYSAVYDRHLPLRRRLPWRLLEALLMRIGVPLMRKWKL